MLMKKTILIAIVLLLGLLTLAAARAESVAIEAARDNTLIEDPNGSASNGAGPFIFSGHTKQRVFGSRRAVIAFDIAGAVPTGATILKVTLRMVVDNSQTGRADMRLHRLISDWGEGASFWTGGRGAPSTPGDATWIHAFFDSAFWSSPGGDYDPLPSAQASAGFVGKVTWGPTQEMRDDVQGWLDEPGAQFGWIIIGDERRLQTSKAFVSREHADTSRRPVLTVEFEAPCMPDPRGDGYWIRQCLGIESISGGLSPGKRGRGPGEPGETGFDPALIACAGEVLAGMDPEASDPCQALLPRPARDSCDQARRKAATLAFNMCAGRMQGSCLYEGEPGGCADGTVADLMAELQALFVAGECRQAKRCLTAMD
jgi:hypothetical protein